jgi:predicted peroxiredoxin
MALKMEDVMSADHDVMMDFDIKGVAALVKDAPEITHDGFESSKGMLQRLSAKNIKIEACPSCLKAAGHKPENLVPGVKIADKQDFFWVHPGADSFPGLLTPIARPTSGDSPFWGAIDIRRVRLGRATLLNAGDPNDA